MRTASSWTLVAIAATWNSCYALVAVLPLRGSYPLLSYQERKRPCRLYSSRDEESLTPEQHEYRSISDYMGGHHAGKFDFDPRICGVTALNYEKSMVFDDSIGTPERNRLAPLETDSEAPKWATRVVDLEPTTEMVRIGDTTVTLKNDEISWEPFYATIESPDEPLPRGVDVSPATGNLAPRGGSDPYTDQAILVLAKTEETPTVPASSSLYLVVRTELDFWSWRVVLD